MGLIPGNALARLQFYETHAPVFASNAVAIGTSTTAVTDMTTKATAARTAYDAHLTAQAASKTATQAWHQAMIPLSSAGSAIIDQIRGKAKISGDGIYTLAGLPSPALPSPMPPPGTPYQLKVELKPSGALSLTWKCNNPAGSQGTLYQISRRVDGVPASPAFEYLVAVGGRSFVDDTLPAGSSTVIYRIQAARTTAVGDAAEFVVNIGTGGSGMAIASVAESAPIGGAKIAA